MFIFRMYIRLYCGGIFIFLIFFDDLLLDFVVLICIVEFVVLGSIVIYGLFWVKERLWVWDKCFGICNVGDESMGFDFFIVVLYYLVDI